MGRDAQLFEVLNMDRETLAFIARCAFLLNSKREYFTEREIETLESYRYDGYSIDEAVEAIRRCREIDSKIDFMEAC